MHRFVKWLKLIKKAAPYKNVFQQILDVIQTKIRVNISPSEYYYFQFYKGDKTWKEKERYIGMHGSLYWPYELNRLKYNVILTNKYIQKNLFIGFGLPTPRLVTTIGHRLEITTLDEFKLFLASCQKDIVLKPVSSMGGHNILSLTHRDNSFFMSDEEYTPEKIWRHMEPILHVGYLVEERISNNRQIDTLFPHSLNCFRVCTIKLHDQKWEIITWGLKLGTGKSEQAEYI
jgi:hypothetical protein